MSEPTDWEAREIVEQVHQLRSAWESDADGRITRDLVGQAGERLLTRFLLDHHRIAVALEKIAARPGVDFHPSVLRPRDITLDTLTGAGLDAAGDIQKLPRRPQEADADYRERLRSDVLHRHPTHAFDKPDASTMWRDSDGKPIPGTEGWNGPPASEPPEGPGIGPGAPRV